MSERNLVESPAILKMFGIPSSTLFRLVDQGKIRAHRVPRSQYHQRRKFLFDPEEVKEDIAKLPKPKP